MKRFQSERPMAIKRAAPAAAQKSFFIPFLQNVGKAPSERLLRCVRKFPPLHHPGPVGCNLMSQQRHLHMQSVDRNESDNY